MLGGVTHQGSEGVDHPPSLKALWDRVGCKAPELNHAAVPKVSPHTAAGDQVTDNGQETSSESEPSHEEEDAPCEEEDVEASKGDAEVLSDGQVASNGNEGQRHAHIQNTLTGVSHVFGMHEETDAESGTEEQIQSIQQEWHQPSPKEDTPSKDLNESSSEEEQPTDEALHERPDNGLGNWTQILMLGGTRRLLKALQDGPPETP